MIERLLEIWLDSASERSYQAPFCQVLIAKGHRVIHSTRHSPIEFGKDVITVGPDHVACAYQLKGRPGKRVNSSYMEAVHQQLLALRDLNVSIPGAAKGPHRSFFVTNGRIQEEARLYVENLNRGPGANGRTIELIGRDELLSDFRDLGVSMWPSEADDFDRLLSLLAANGRGPLPVAELTTVLGRMLRLDGDAEKFRSADELRRHATSAGLLVAISMRTFQREKNHWALIQGWTLYSAYVIASCERWDRSFKRNGAPSVDVAEETITDLLFGLFEEADERGVLVEGEALVDSHVHDARRLLVSACSAVLGLRLAGDNQLADELSDRIAAFMDRNAVRVDLWGEAAIPQVLAVAWFHRATEAGLRHEAMIEGLLQSVLGANVGRNARSLPSPYYGVEDVVRDRLHAILPDLESPIQDARTRGSFFALPLIHLLCRRMMKQVCKMHWPDVTRISHCRFEPEKPWMYCLAESRRGTNVTEILAPEKRWEEFRAEAMSDGTPAIPAALAARPFLVLLFVLVCPQRATPEVIRFLDSQLPVK